MHLRLQILTAVKAVIDVLPAIDACTLRPPRAIPLNAGECHVYAHIERGQVSEADQRMRHEANLRSELLVFEVRAKGIAGDLFSKIHDGAEAIENALDVAGVDMKFGGLIKSMIFDGYEIAIESDNEPVDDVDVIVMRYTIYYASRFGDAGTPE